jgi:hypothetical protein
VKREAKDNSSSFAKPSISWIISPARIPLRLILLSSPFTRFAKDEGERAIPFTLSVSCQNEDLTNTIASMLADDSNESQAFNTTILEKPARIGDANPPQAPGQWQN